MNNDFEGLCDDGWGCIFAAFAAGAIAVAGIGVYGLRKVGVTGKKAWLGVLAAPVVYIGARAYFDSKQAQRVAYVERATANAPVAPQPAQPRVAPLNDFQLLDQLALMGLQ